MQTFDPHRRYLEGNVVGATPVRLVIVLYEAAIDNLRDARRCLEARDPMQRSHFVNKTCRILCQLLLTLNVEAGGEIAVGLKQLYAYMQSRLIHGHVKQTAEPFLEVERLLTTLLEGWYKVERVEAQKLAAAADAPASAGSQEQAASLAYGGYFEAAAGGSGVAATF